MSQQRYSPRSSFSHYDIPARNDQYRNHPEEAEDVEEEQERIDEDMEAFQERMQENALELAAQDELMLKKWERDHQEMLEEQEEDEAREMWREVHGMDRRIP